MAQEDDFLQALRATFMIEAEEHLQVIASGLLELEKDPGGGEQSAVVEAIFRAAHSLKGAARAVNYSEIEAICQSMEDVFAAWKKGAAAPSAPILDTLHRSLDKVSSAVASPMKGKAADDTAAQATMPVPNTLPHPQSESSRPAVETPQSPTSTSETVRISVGKLDATLLQAEEMLTAKLSSAQRVADLAGIGEILGVWRKEWRQIQADVQGLRPNESTTSLPPPTGAPAHERLLDFFDWSDEFLRTMENRLAGIERRAKQDHFAVGKLVDDLLDDSKRLLMLPLATPATLFSKLIRDLCRDQGKAGDLVFQGGEVEIDRRILEEMKDPLVHILRNCVGHGIESPDERRRAGKPMRATVTLAVLPVNGHKVELRISDDGAGIDPEKVKSSAIRHGRMSAAEAQQLSEPEILDLIFQSEISTSPAVTELSGRGLGLAIVREKAQKLGGRVSVESQLGKGTTIRIILPIALATFRGILLEVRRRTFVIPTMQVACVRRFRMGDVETVEGRDTVVLEGRPTALAWMADVLEMEGSERPHSAAGPIPLIVLGEGDSRVAFAVDSVLGEQEVIVKRLSKPLVRVRNISGATVLGSGEVAPILHVPDLLKSARRTSRRVPLVPEAPPHENATKSILVAEDSITSRMFLKGLLEAAGYRVKTAVDGMEAFATLRTERFDLLVSDVEMPRLNGFDLTSRIRADRNLAELPVILVTALDSREDRERGIDVGANAYLAKSSFDQSNLLEAVRRLA